MDYDTAKSLYEYDRETGVLTHKDPLVPRMNGKKVGTPDRKGYLCVRCGTKVYKVHRIVWLIEYGAFPTGYIDHINGIKNDNRLSNLRDVTATDNQQNIILPQRNNKIGIRGVTMLRGKYIASIWYNGRKEFIGSYATAEEAGIAYLKRKIEVHPGFIRECLPNALLK